MFFCYNDENGPFTGRPVPYHKQNATKHWSTHMSNFYYLRFVETNKLATREEILQARKEIPICQRKIDHWQRHMNFDPEEAARLKQDLNKIWHSALTEMISVDTTKSIFKTTP
jgi:hypothetical protein